MTREMIFTPSPLAGEGGVRGVIFGLLGLAVLLGGCGQGPSGSGMSRVEITFNTGGSAPAQGQGTSAKPAVRRTPAPSGVATILLDITRPGLGCQFLQFDTTAIPADGKVALDLPSGSTFFHALALDAGGELLYEGYALAALFPDTKTFVGIPMQEVDLEGHTGLAAGGLGCRLTVIAVEQATGRPINGATVSLGPTGDQTTTTNAKGIATFLFSVSFPPPQDVHVFASGHGAFSIYQIPDAALILPLNLLAASTPALVSGTVSGSASARSLLVHTATRGDDWTYRLSSVSGTLGSYSLTIEPSPSVLNFAAFEVSGGAVTNYASKRGVAAVTTAGGSATQDLLFPTTAPTATPLTGSVSIPAALTAGGSRLAVRSFADLGPGGRLLTGLDPSGSTIGETAVTGASMSYSLSHFSLTDAPGYRVEAAAQISSGDNTRGASRIRTSLRPSLSGAIETLTLPDLPTTSVPASGSTGAGLTPTLKWAPPTGAFPNFYFVTLRPGAGSRTVWTIVVPAGITAPDPSALVSITLPTVPAGVSRPLSAGTQVEWNVQMTQLLEPVAFHSESAMTEDFEFRAAAEAVSKPATFTP